MEIDEIPIPLSNDDIDQLRLVFDQQAYRPEEDRDWVPAYRLILNRIKNADDPRHFFFRRAAAINGNEQTPPDILASLRLQGFIPQQPAQFIQKMSGRIGKNIITRVLDDKAIPPVGPPDGLWWLDISAAFSEIKSSVPINEFVAWGGGPFAAYLGINNYETKIKTSAERRMMTRATMIACEEAGLAAAVKAQPGELTDVKAVSVCIGSVFKTSLEAYADEGEAQALVFKRFVSAVRLFLSHIWSPTR